MLLPVPGPRLKRVAVVGAGPAGLATATALAERGHHVDLFEAADDIGGQFRLAMRVPGKEEFGETLRYYRRRVEILGVRLALSTTADAATIVSGEYDDVVVATGVLPRQPAIPGIDHAKVVTYPDALNGGVPPGSRVAVIGAGGIGVDVSHYLTQDRGLTRTEFEAHWGIGDPATSPGGVARRSPQEPVRHVTLLQRKETPVGAGLGKTSGWAHRANLRSAQVELVSGASYERIDDDGLHVRHGREGEPRLISADHVVICAGQESNRTLADELVAAGLVVHVIGGADVATELDAKRAIEQGTRLAATL